MREKILLVQTGFIGDCILGSPAVKAIADKHPESEITLLTTPAGKALYARDPLISNIVVYDKKGRDRGTLSLFRLARELRAQNFTLAYALHKSFRTALLLLLAGIPKRIGFTDASGSFLYTKLRARPKEAHEVKRQLALIEDETFQADTTLRLPPPTDDEMPERVRHTVGKVAIFPGSVWKTKRWNEDRYSELCVSIIRDLELEIVLLGSPAERSIGEYIAQTVNAAGFGASLGNLMGELSLEETIYIVSEASLVVCNDSMALHLASTYKRPTVAIFCATSPAFGFGPWENPHAVVVEKQDLPCKPCRRHGGNICPTGTEACMRELESGKVLQAVRKMLS